MVPNSEDAWNNILCQFSANSHRRSVLIIFVRCGKERLISRRIILDNARENAIKNVQNVDKRIYIQTVSIYMKYFSRRDINFKINLLSYCIDLGSKLLKKSVIKRNFYN